MAAYDRKILHALLDSYERSLLARGENKVAVHIAYRFTTASMPEYFDVSSMEYEVIHACLGELEERGLVTVKWQDNVPGNIVQKVILNEAAADEAYRYLGRTPKAVYVQRQTALLESLRAECTAPVTTAFIDRLLERLEADLPVREYFDPADLEKSERLIRCVYAVETNEKSSYVREFSILHFGDSKVLEGMKGTVKKVFNRFCPDLADADEKAIFAEYGIYDTPDYVYVKGDGLLYFAQQPVPLSGLRQGIGICGEDLDLIRMTGTTGTRKVITIENLTTFFQWQEPDSLMIYLGGYHNRTRRRLLRMIYAQLPDAQYLHFGDIDVGGFEIYEDLCRKSSIPFQTYHMGTAELETYRAYAKKLTVNDRRRTQQFLEKHPDCGYREVLAYMLAHGIKLEQECIAAGAAEALWVQTASEPLSPTHGIV